MSRANKKWSEGKVVVDEEQKRDRAEECKAL